MKKTFTININGTIFHIEEDAYEALQQYLLNLKNHFGNSEDGVEIISDIEARIAEIFIQKISDEKKVVTLDWVNEVVEIMGTPESFAEESGEDEPLSGSKKRKRKLYRDPEQSVLSGVCGGLGAYFNMDPAIIRIIFVISIFITSGFSFLAYLVVWVVVPKATSTAHRLEMRGEEVTVKNIENFIKEEVNFVKESYHRFRKSSFFSKAKN